MDLRAKRHTEAKRFFVEQSARLTTTHAERFWQRQATSDNCTRDFLSRFGIRADKPNFDFETFVEELLTSRPIVLTHTLYFYVNVLGSWPDACALASAIVGATSVDGEDRQVGMLLQASGQALAIGSGDRGARSAWRKAAIALPGGFDRFLLFLRIATVELKRFRDEGGYRRALAAARNEAQSLSGAGHSVQDEQFALALASNLDAYALLRTGDEKGAKREIDFAIRAFGEISNPQLTLEAVVAQRYRIMVAINQGLLLVTLGRWSPAAQAFARSVLLARDGEPDSIAETLSITGSFQMMRKQWKQANETLREAADLYATDVRPSGYEAVCKLLALSYVELSDSRSAARWLDRARTTLSSPKNETS